MILIVGQKWHICYSINNSLISKGCSNNSTQDRETIFIDLVFKNYVFNFYLKYVLLSLILSYSTRLVN